MEIIEIERCKIESTYDILVALNTIHNLALVLSDKMMNLSFIGTDRNEIDSIVDSIVLHCDIFDKQLQNLKPGTVLPVN